MGWGGDPCGLAQTPSPLHCESGHTFLMNDAPATDFSRSQDIGWQAHRLKTAQDGQGGTFRDRLKKVIFGDS